MRIVFSIIAFILLSSTLIGCGQTGKLYLPPAADHQQTTADAS